MVTADDGAMTVTFHLDQPDPNFLESLSFPLAWVLPTGTPMRRLTTTLVPSTGPYKIAEVVPASG
jgi:peptide/nickel transport system substrate-binding protein